MKRIVSMLATLSILMALCVPAMAAPIEPVSGEESAPSTKAVSTVIPGGAREATEEQMQQAKENEKMLVVEEGDNGIMPLAFWYSIDNIYYYGQETSTSCGPACARMILKNLTEINYSEATIRNNTNYSSTVGTYLSDIVSYINKEQYVHEYGTYYAKPKTTMKDHLYASIAWNCVPTIIGVRPSASAGIPYSGTSGHMLMVYAVTTDKSSVMVCDPWGGYTGRNNIRWYEITCDDLFDGYDDINCGYAY